MLKFNLMAEDVELIRMALADMAKDTVRYGTYFAGKAKELDQKIYGQYKDN